MKKVWHYFDLAGQMAIKRDDRRTFKLGCVALRNDGAMVRSNNGPSPVPTRSTHAEYKVALKLDHGATVFVTRIGRGGAYRNARPCRSCQKALRSRRVKRVYYTLSPDRYGIYFPMKDKFHD